MLSTRGLSEYKDTDWKWKDRKIYTMEKKKRKKNIYHVTMWHKKAGVGILMWGRADLKTRNVTRGPFDKHKRRPISGKIK